MTSPSWRVVPAVATEAMIDAADFDASVDGDAATEYAAMLAAAPAIDYDALAAKLCKALHGYDDIQPDRDILAAALREMTL